MSERGNLLLLEALENERRYTAKELHDGIAQTVLQLGLQAGICRKLLERDQPDMLATELQQLEQRVQHASGQLRALIQDLRPPALDSDEALLDEYMRYVIDIHARREGPPVDYQNKTNGVDAKLSAAQILGLVRIVQEGLLNVRKHAQANHVRLTISAEQDNLYLTIADDGRGFDAAEVAARPVDSGGAGLTNLRMRTEAVGGALTVTRDSIGSGTKVTVILPL